ncbi:UNVERIFIED_CONTAM: hypothetical protein GTU68_009026 [Idotea baltica]|nr:hypothetical protein [Idotea baltica]
MPWLLGTALLHSAIVTEKRAAFKSWTILLAILTFSLSLLGTFIVRSGLLTSVHAFAVDPERGFYILGLLAVSIGGSLALFAWRAPMMEPGGLFKPISREAGLLFNNMILATATGTVLFGTLYPLFFEALTGGEKISVGPPFFNAAFVPMMLPLVFAMALGPLLSWKRADLAGVFQRLKFVAVLSVLATLAIWYRMNGGPVLGYLSILLAFWLLFATVREWVGRIRLFEVPFTDAVRRARYLPRASHGMSMAHAGVAVVILGMVGSSVWKSEQILFAQPGTDVSIAGFEVEFRGVERVRGPNYVADRGTLDVSRNGERLTTLYPERRSYPVAQSTTTESAIRSTLAGDLYISIGQPALEEADDSGAWTLRILYEPLVNLIWIGAGMLVIGGGLSLSDRRLRVGAPKRAAVSGDATVPAE